MCAKHVFGLVEHGMALPWYMQWQHDSWLMFHDLNHNKVAGNGKCLVSMLNLAISVEICGSQGKATESFPVRKDS